MVFWLPKPKYKVLIVKNISGQRTLIAKRRTTAANPKFTMRVDGAKRTFPIDLTRPLYRGRKFLIYEYDLDDGQVYGEVTDLPIDIKALDVILNGRIVPQLVESMKTGGFDLTAIIMIVMGAALGFFAGAVFGPMVMP